ncbi:MAG: hypothetical protein HUU55_19445 [Myxococcales bacterium]|nr:hypothetical protein [Myxococcales bacterium]
MVRMITVVALVVAALAVIPSAPAQPALGPALDLQSLPEVAAEPLPRGLSVADLVDSLAVGQGELNPFPLVVPAGPNQVALAWTLCTPRRCTATVAVVLIADAKPRIVKKRKLPDQKKTFAVDGVQIDTLTLADLDGDGESELVIVYRVTEPPRPALGSRLKQRAAVYNLPAFSPLFDLTLRQSGAGSEMACDSQWVPGKDAAGKPQFVQRKICAIPDCAGETAPPCAPARTTDTLWRYIPRKDRFQPGAPVVVKP